MITHEEFYNGLQPIEQKLVDFYQNVLEMEKPKEILEVGSGWGIFSRSAIDFTDAKIMTIDKNGGYGLPQFEKHTAGFENRLNKIVEDSHVLLPKMEATHKDFFDFIFVDGDHTQEGAAKDISQSWLLLKSGGMMMIDDVFHKENWRCFKHDIQEFGFGVTIALWGFLQAHESEFDGYPILITRGHGIVLIKKK